MPEIPVVGSGYSWLQEFAPQAAAANVAAGHVALAGFGRATLAHPDFARALALFYQPPRPAPGIHPQASIAKTALVAAGISAFVPAETAVAPVNRTGSELMFAALEVHAADRERALDILKHASHR